MHICPVCEHPAQVPVCPECGFDITRDFEQFPTLGSLPGFHPAKSQLRRSYFHARQALAACPVCGSHQFGLTEPEMTAICLRCHQKMPSPFVAQLEKELLASRQRTAELETQLRILREQLTPRQIRLHPSAPNIAVGACRECSLVLRAEGTVELVGWSDCDVSAWRDITAVAGGSAHVVGLRSDGTVVATGSNGAGQCDVAGWRNITAIGARLFYTMGLKKDGTVVATGSNYAGQCDVSAWRDITAIAAGPTHSVGLRRDGTVVATGSSVYQECDVRSWQNVTAVAAGYGFTLGLCRNGTLVATGLLVPGACREWTDITAIAAGRNHVLGLKKDGTLVAAGDNNYGQCETEGITDVVAIAAGDNHNIILHADGSYVVTGSYYAS